MRQEPKDLRDGGLTPTQVRQISDALGKLEWTEKYALVVYGRSPIGEELRDISSITKEQAKKLLYFLRQCVGLRPIWRR